jgi:hypothetical protein
VKAVTFRLECSDRDPVGGATPDHALRGTFLLVRSMLRASASNCRPVARTRLCPGVSHWPHCVGGSSGHIAPRLMGLTAELTRADVPSGEISVRSTPDTARSGLIWCARGWRAAWSDFTSAAIPLALHGQSLSVLDQSNIAKAPSVGVPYEGNFLEW